MDEELPQRTVDDTVRAIFSEHFGDAASRSERVLEGHLLDGILEGFPSMEFESAYDLAFHLSDWQGDAAFIIALSLAPERFTKQEIADGIMGFLCHAPNHVAAAAKISGLPVTDIFKLGVLDGQPSSTASADSGSDEEE
jgi:hypothetical protein